MRATPGDVMNVTLCRGLDSCKYCEIRVVKCALICLFAWT